MGRKKGYDRAELLAKAKVLFHQHGYMGTSTQMLVEALGVNRNSMYSEFGSKLELFELVLEEYEQMVFQKFFGPLEGNTSGIKEIEGLFDFFAEVASNEAAGLGCMLTNSAVEFGSQDPTRHQFLKGYFPRIVSAFENALRGAKTQGEVLTERNTEKDAKFFTALILGIFVLTRANAEANIVEATALRASDYLAKLSIPIAPPL